MVNPSCTPQSNLGEQFLGLCQDVWIAKAHLVTVGPELDPADGLYESVQELACGDDLSALAQLAPRTLETVGANCIQSYVAAEQRQLDRDQAAAQLQQAKEAVTDFAQPLIGHVVTVRSLRPGDRPLDKYGRYRTSFVETAMGRLNDNSLRASPDYSVMVLSAIGRFSRLSSTRYIAHLRGRETFDPRVALEIAP